MQRRKRLHSALNTVKRPPTARTVTQTRRSELLAQYGHVADTGKQILPPTLSLLRFAIATQKPCAKGEMPSLVISDHVWLNKTGTGVSTQSVLKRYLVSALNGSADDSNAHSHYLSGEEGEYTPCSFRLSTAHFPA